MTTEGLKNIITDLFNIKDIKLVVLSIVLEEGHLGSCICVYESKSPKESEILLRQKLTRVDGKLIDPWQLWRCSQYFDSLAEFTSSFDKKDNVLIVKKK